MRLFFALDKYPLGVYNKNTLRGYNDKDMEIDMENNCECCKRTKKRSEEEYKCLLNRLSRIEGQIRGIKGMLENDAYCVDVITQVAAATAALNSFNRELLANHIKTCVSEDIRQGKDETVDELLKTLQKLMK